MKSLFVFFLIAFVPFISNAQNNKNPFQSLIEAYRVAPAYNSHFTNSSFLDGMVGGYCVYPDGRSVEANLQTMFYTPSGAAFGGISKYVIMNRKEIGTGYSGIEKLNKALRYYNPVVFNNFSAISVGNPSPTWFGHQKPLTGVLYLKYSNAIVPGKISAIVLETANERNLPNPPVVRACYFYEPLTVMY